MIHITCTTLTSTRQHHSKWRCDRCNTTTNMPPVTPNITPHTPSNNPTTHTTSNTTTQTQNTPFTWPTQTHTRHTLPRTHINILQANVDGLTQHTVTELKQFLTDNHIHIALLQETKLTHTKQTPNIKDYSHIRTDRTTGQGGGLITYIHTSILYKDTTQTTQALFQNDTTLEIQSLSVSSGHKQEYNIFNIYIPPDTSHAVPVQYSPQLLALTPSWQAILTPKTLPGTNTTTTTAEAST